MCAFMASRQAKKGWPNRTTVVTRVITLGGGSDPVYTKLCVQSAKRISRARVVCGP